MKPVLAAFAGFARQGRAVLVAGLAIGILLPGLAGQIRGWLPELVSLMLFVAALRIGARNAWGSFSDLRTMLALVAIYQVALPLGLAGAFHMLGVSGPLATALVLMAAGASIAGSPNLAVMVGHDPAPALRLMIAGTALLPLSVIPVFVAWPLFGSVAGIGFASIKLLMVILSATGLAFALRGWLFPDPSKETIAAIDGVSALLMAVLVVGLMSAVGPALRAEPWLFVGTLCLAFLANFGLQALAFIALGFYQRDRTRAAYSIIAGNRNIALFLAALPLSVTDPVLLFVGCYQIPMYLTPILLDRLYKNA